MNREVGERSVVQEMIGEGHDWWSLSNNNNSPFLPSVSSSIPTSFCSSNSMGGLVGEEDRYMYSQFQSKKSGNNWAEQLVYPTTNVQDMVSVKQENHEINANEDIHSTKLKPPWNQILQPSSSPLSCVTSNLGNNIARTAECSHKSERKHQHQNSSECYSSGNGAPFKKARIQGSCSPQSTIKALSIPYLSSESGPHNSRHHGQGEKNCVFPDDPGQLLNDNSIRNTSDQSIKEVTKKDLRTKGLCLVPVSFPLDIATDHSMADYWAPAFLGGFGR
ncbi:Transcription factor bHLH68 [Carex littledalei]|uniref:Transcription factor bHLH68 n=1 Tax=Carex littledalei TaxID=544730 RepID=A0A833R494_9POAL|nr:Transcription factor bHLH68 [Carex littledalei]